MTSITDTAPTSDRRATRCEALAVKRALELRAEGNTIATAADQGAIEAARVYYGASDATVRGCAIQASSNAARVALGSAPI